MIMNLTEESFIKDINRLLRKKIITSDAQLISVLNHREMFYCFYYVKQKYNYSIDYYRDRTMKEIINKIIKGGYYYE